jgi:hypothetical protein
MAPGAECQTEAIRVAHGRTCGHEGECDPLWLTIPLRPGKLNVADELKLLIVKYMGALSICQYKTY